MSEQSKPTPGPWGIGISISNAGFVEVRSKDGQGVTLASVGGADFAHSAAYPIKEQEALANARLIAAAPELLAACEFVMRCIEHPHEGAGERVADRARAETMLREAIAKVQGEPA